jgi:hypothetical protein
MTSSIIEPETSQPLVVTVSTIYALSMPKFIYVQIKGVDKPARIRGDEMEQAGNEWQIKLGPSQVAMFRRDDVQGWWIQDEDNAIAF